VRSEGCVASRWPATWMRPARRSARRHRARAITLRASRSRPSAAVQTAIRRRSSFGCNPVAVLADLGLERAKRSAIVRVPVASASIAARTLAASALASCSPRARSVCPKLRHRQFLRGGIPPSEREVVEPAALADRDLSWPVAPMVLAQRFPAPSHEVLRRLEVIISRVSTSNSARLRAAQGGAFRGRSARRTFGACGRP